MNSELSRVTSDFREIVITVFWFQDCVQQIKIYFPQKIEIEVSNINPESKNYHILDKLLENRLL